MLNIYTLGELAIATLLAGTRTYIQVLSNSSFIQKKIQLIQRLGIRYFKNKDCAILSYVCV